MAADYKQKYLNMRSQLVKATDVAFRLGYEEGMKEAAMQQVQQQQAQMEQEQAMAEQQAMAEGGEGAPVDEQAAMEGEMPESGAPMEEGAPEEEMPSGMASELDKHIDELANLVAKGEKPSILDMRKKVEELSDLRKSQKEKLDSKTKANASSQKKIVDGILKKWEDESKEAAGGLEEILKQHEIQVEE